MNLMRPCVNVKNNIPSDIAFNALPEYLNGRPDLVIWLI
jgi:hypothetical protein